MRNTSADLTFKSNVQVMDGLIAKLVEKKNEFKTNKEPHWGHVGDTSYVNEKLVEALNLCGVDTTDLI